MVDLRRDIYIIADYEVNMETTILPGTLDALSEIRAFVQKASENAGLAEKRAYRLALAVDEIATNIVMHGYDESNTSGEIGVSAVIENGSLTVCLSDTAPPYNPRSQSGPDNLDSPLEERQIGGLGVFLAQKNVDEFRYEYVDGENRNFFVVNQHGSETL